MLNGATQASFSIGTYDTSRPLVIDPTLTYSTHVGGSSTALEKDISVRPAVDFSTLDYVLVVLSTGPG